jgi:type IV pilus biogenesis protein CpaD/CtpE
MSTRRNRLVLAALFGATLLGATLSGCSSTPRFDEKFGSSVHANLSAQTLDPAAAANANPATGIDGAAARSVQERYQRSFKEPAPSSNQGMVGANGQ